MSDDAHKCDAHLSTVVLSPDASPGGEAAEAHVTPTPADDEELSLVDLLLRASETIRAERARADAVEYENGILRAQLDGVRAAYHRATAQHGISDELLRYVERYVVPEEVGTRSPRAASGNEPPPRHRSCSKTAVAAHAGSSASSVARAPSRASVTATTQSYRKGWEATAAASPPVEAETGREPTPASFSRPRQAPTAAADVADSPETSPRTLPLHDDSKENRQQQRGSQPSISVQTMACRLRRALAPRPTETVVDDIIHSMVTALQRDVQAKLEDQCVSAPPSRLRGFALVRVRPCVYRILSGPPAEVKAIARSRGADGTAALRSSTSPLTAFPFRLNYLPHQASRGHQKTLSSLAETQPQVRSVVVHLAVDSGALRVVRGGGHVDFVEFLERFLRIKLGGP
ncbi:hypothetical protein ABB37_10078 [Leptomonas pyrrhocoris]|uniref:Uncharacterized protein n=1 Tax=Leptomonas pyrrhocoris TaxID=157538 RepID=A0A0N0VCN3_LEPPY|nr:hypothetical protein ABB37_10078 [Leptomonas pyrrhocoris]KPA73178.1 hypothetical protein ABB37_10078 [Leptomonas pyrrhocoris]|eukprot:XP_015651617.1 hypothetical protein ABB37_10078 [Leptomonas pyrrhocoris]